MRLFVEWWGKRVKYVFRGEDRRENFFQRAITIWCIFWWKFWMLFLWLNIWLWLMKIPWPKVGRRIAVSGLENLRDPATKKYYAENLLILPNHYQYTSVILAMLGFFPRAILNPEKYFPWQTPNRKILSDPFLVVASLGPLIVMDSDKSGTANDGGALREALRRLKEKTLIIFIEGTRSFHARHPKITTRSGIVIGYPFWGAGILIHYNRPTVVPVLIKGEKEIYPEDASIIKFLSNLCFSRSKLEVIYGKPIDFSWLPPRGSKLGREELKELARAICERVRDEIAALDQ